MGDSQLASPMFGVYIFDGLVALLPLMFSFPQEGLSVTILCFDSKLIRKWIEGKYEDVQCYVAETGLEKVYYTHTTTCIHNKIKRVYPNYDFTSKEKMNKGRV